MIGDKLQILDQLRSNMTKYNLALDLFSQIDNIEFWTYEEDEAMFNLLELQFLAVQNTIYSMLKQTETVYTQLKEEDDNG